MSGARGVIFDFDGTLADTLPDLADAVNVGLGHFGLPAQPAADIGDWIGAGIVVLCQRALAAAVAAAAPRGRRGRSVPVEELARVVGAHYTAHRLDKTRPFPGIPELLDALAIHRVPLAVLSNKPHEHTAPLVNALFARWPFVAVEGYRDEASKKPNPRNALHIAGVMGLPPGGVLMVGDSAIDVATARNAGMVAVGVTWGYRPRGELLAAGARHLIEAPQELLPLVG